MLSNQLYSETQSWFYCSLVCVICELLRHYPGVLLLCQTLRLDSWPRRGIIYGPARSLHHPINILTPVLIPHKLLDLGVVHWPMRRSRGFGGLDFVLLVLFAQQLSDGWHVFGYCASVRTFNPNELIRQFHEVRYLCQAASPWAPR